MSEAEQIIASLSLDDKIPLLAGRDAWHTQPLPDGKLRSLTMSDGPHGLRKIVSTGGLGVGEASVRTVCFPCACSLANSWDLRLLREVGASLGEIAAAEEVDILLGPGVNIKRNPLCGRNFEYFSEDPLLAGKLGAAWVEGLQSSGTGASLKHFCANNQETLRMSSSSVVDERTLREIYLKPFEIVVKAASPFSVMCSYNRLNGTYLSDNRRLLHDILRNEWGFQGFVVSDWGAVNDRVLAVKAGLSLEMPGLAHYFDRSVRQALASGKLDESDIDQCLLPFVKTAKKLAERTVRPAEQPLAKAHALARDAAARSAVLLSNNGALPLPSGSKCLIVGTLARISRYQGAGSSRVNPFKVISLLDGLRSENLKITYEDGYTLDSQHHEGLAERAVIAAHDADVIIFAAGLPEIDECEGFDRPDMKLPQCQNDLLQRLTALGKPVVVVLSAGSAVEMPWADHVSAILHMGLGGEAAGGAAADVLTGRVNPSGKLAESYPIRYEDHVTSSFWQESERQAFYKEGIFVGYRFYDSAQIPVRFPFGHGLSYTQFSYTDLSVKPAADGFDVSFRLENTGGQDGEEIVQLYISDRSQAVHKPEQELKEFSKIAVAAGQSAAVSLHVPAEAFSHYNLANRQWLVSNGSYEIRIGASSRDLRLRQTVQVSFGLELQPETAGWYSHLNGTPKLADLQLQMPEPIELEPPYRRGTFDINASLKQLGQSSLLALLIMRVSERVIAKMLGIKPDYRNVEFRMLMANSQESALRNMHLMSPRQLSKSLIRLILLSANGLFTKNTKPQIQDGGK